jgi:hypothetical protein
MYTYKYDFGLDLTDLSAQVVEVPCKCPTGACAEITSDFDPRGSPNLDAPDVLAGLYPAYFDQVRRASCYRGVRTGHCWGSEAFTGVRSTGRWFGV